jgi:hypothetical protein
MIAFQGRRRITSIFLFTLEKEWTIRIGDVCDKKYR